MLILESVNSQWYPNTNHSSGQIIATKHYTRDHFLLETYPISKEDKPRVYLPPEIAKEPLADAPVNAIP